MKGIQVRCVVEQRPFRVSISSCDYLYDYLRSSWFDDKANKNNRIFYENKTKN